MTLASLLTPLVFLEMSLSVSVITYSTDWSTYVDPDLRIDYAVDEAVEAVKAVSNGV